MYEFLQNFHFLRPWVLLFLIMPAGLYFKNLTFSNTVSSWENICDKKLLDFLLVTDKSLKKISIKKFIYTGLLATILAAAGPCWKKVEIPTFEIENPTMFVLSLAQDMQLKDITPSRLDRAKFIISDITENVPSGQFGLEVYSQEPYVITPLTDDAQLIKNLLPQVVLNIVPDNGDRLDRAIALALERFKTAGYSSGNIVVFASDVGQRFDLALEKIKEAAALNYTIHVIDTSYSGNEKLQMMAEKGNGVYLRVKDDNLQQLLAVLRQADEEKIKLSQNLRSNYLDYGYYLVFISLLCMLPFFRRGLLVLLFCFSFISQAHAGFLLNDNQEGLKLFQQGLFEEATSKFKDSVWRGVSLYKQEKNEEALKEFSKEKNSETALYNKGVVLARLCHYEEALGAFNEVLKLNPNNEDAIYNKKVLDDLFVKAKENPSVLNCQDNQQQNDQQEQNKDNNQQQNSSSDNQNQDNSADSNQQQGEQSNQQTNKEQQDQENNQQKNDDTQPASNNQENQKNQDNSADENQQQNNQEQTLGGGSSSEDSQQQNNDNANSPSQQKTDTQPDENNATPTSADDNNGSENQSQNEEGEEDNGTEEQTKNQDVGLMNAKQGDDNTEYDEEALAMQRRYREIPEDVGGLLREFIKKDYLRGRYKNEN